MPPTDTRDLLIRGHQTRIMSDYKFTIESSMRNGPFLQSTHVSRHDFHAGRIRGSVAAKHGHGRL